MKKLQEFTASNRDAWDASAAAFEGKPEWQELVDWIRRGGFSDFDQTMTQTLQALGVRGRRAVQIGCNNGRELLSLPSFGAAPVLGIDISENFLAQARKLAGIAGSDCRFLCADIYDLPADVPKDFDLGLITIGVLNWMPDLWRFFEVVGGLLADDAILVIYETHPFMEMFDPEAKEPFAPVRSYFDKTPDVASETITYDGSPGKPGPTSYWFTHGLGEIVTACVAAGLAVERLSEHSHSIREVDYDIYEGQPAQIPMSFTGSAKDGQAAGHAMISGISLSSIAAMMSLRRSFCCFSRLIVNGSRAPFSSSAQIASSKSRCWRRNSSSSTRRTSSDFIERSR